MRFDFDSVEERFWFRGAFGRGRCLTISNDGRGVLLVLWTNKFVDNFRVGCFFVMPGETRTVKLARDVTFTGIAAPGPVWGNYCVN